MTRAAPHPGFLPGDQVTLEHETYGRLRLIVSHTEPATHGLIPMVVCTGDPGYGLFRRPATDYERGWSN